MRATYLLYDERLAMRNFSELKQQNEQLTLIISEFYLQRVSSEILLQFDNVVVYQDLHEKLLFKILQPAVQQLGDQNVELLTASDQRFNNASQAIAV